MMSNINRQMLADNVYFNSVRDSRFKTMKISANLIVPLSEDTASANAVLAGVLSRSCEEYPDFTALSKKLSSLYGADLTVNVTKAGDRQVITISASGIDDRYALDNESIAAELSRLLCSVIFRPNIKNGAFVSSEVEQERRQLLEVIDSEFNDKRIYANSQLIKNMCKNEVFGIKRYGTAEQINAITPDSLYKTWQNLLETATIEIIYVGDSDPEKAAAVFKNTFEKINRAPEAIGNAVVRSADSVNRVVEEMEVSQSKLVMGFRTGICSDDTDCTAASLMCAVLGGTASSKLFCNVREKQSLCYYCSSRFDRHKGIMIVDSGVEGDNVEKAEQGILKEIEDMKNGVISDFEIESAKMAVINAFYSSNDTVGGIENWYSAQLFDGKFKSIAERSAEINAVTKEEIIKAANKLSLDTIYVLKNK